MAPFCPLQALKTARQTEESNKNTIFFTKLPPEIRLMIYDQVFANEQYLVHPDTRNSDNIYITSVLQTTRQMRLEALPEFHRTITIALEGEAGIKAFLSRSNEIIDRHRIAKIETFFSERVIHRPVQSLVCCLRLRSLKIQRRGLTLREDDLHELARDSLADLSNGTLEKVLSKGPVVWGRCAPRDVLAYSVMAFCLAAWRLDFSMGVLQCGLVTSMNRQCAVEYVCMPSVSIGKLTSELGSLTYKFPSRVVEWRVLGRVMSSVLPENNRPVLSSRQGYMWC